MTKRLIYILSFTFLIALAIASSCSCGNTDSDAKHTSTNSIVDSISEPTLTKQLEQKANAIEKLYIKKAKRTSFNGCVLIAQGGQVLYKNAFGYSNFRTREKLSLNSAFQLASASKPFTAAAILLLYQEGKLHLSDSVQKHLIEFPYPGVTVEMLLTHRSGMSNYMYFGEDYCDKNMCYNGGVFDNNAVLDIMKKYCPQRYYPPGRKFEYCNTNYALLASIVESVSNQPFSEFMKEHIFEPLEMYNTWVHIPGDYDKHPSIAKGHKKNGRLEKNQYAEDVVGDKGIYSTVEDLYKWDQALYTEALLSHATKEKAFKGYSHEKWGRRNYGYGWRIYSHRNGIKDIYHNGWWHGYNTKLFRRPADKTTIIILSNRANKSAFQTQDILAILNN